MKNLTSILLVTLICGVSGCSFSRGSRQGKDGATYTITSFNFLMNREGVKFRTEDTNGFKAELEIKKQNPSAEAIEAAAAGAAKGAKSGL